jgi:hypothetical protein
MKLEKVESACTPPVATRVTSLPCEQQRDNVTVTALAVGGATEENQPTNLSEGGKFEEKFYTVEDGKRCVYVEQQVLTLLVFLCLRYVHQA